MSKAADRLAEGDLGPALTEDRFNPDSNQRQNAYDYASVDADTTRLGAFPTRANRSCMKIN